MGSPQQKKFMLNYYAMAILFAIMLMAFKLSGTVSALLSLLAMIIASPVINFKAAKTRWLIVLLLLIVVILFYPDIQQLKEMEGLK